MLLSCEKYMYVINKSQNDTKWQSKGKWNMNMAEIDFGAIKISIFDSIYVMILQGNAG
jgi:hypothetical protein